jgi:hypothetical protein
MTISLPVSDSKTQPVSDSKTQPVSRAPAPTRIHEAHVRPRQREVPDQVVPADIGNRAKLLQLLLGEHPRRHRDHPHHAWANLHEP